VSLTVSPAIAVRLVVCAVGSLVLHVGLGRALDELPPRPPVRTPTRVAVRVVAPPPPPPVLAPAEPPPPPPPPAVTPPPPPPPPVARPRPSPRSTNPPPPTPPPPAAPAISPSPTPGAETGVVAPTGGRPVFGATMESTSSGGAGPAVPIGNTSRPTAGSGPAAPTARGTGEVAAAAEVTRMPLPRGRCAGAYTDAARAAAVEGTVVLDLVVDERGRARDIVVVEGLPHGLSEAAVAALRACSFSPGERAGQPVAVRVRGFKIRFVLADAR
jgi:TonB family protein